MNIKPCVQKWAMNIKWNLCSQLSTSIQLLFVQKVIWNKFIVSVKCAYNVWGPISGDAKLNLLEHSPERCWIRNGCHSQRCQTMASRAWTRRGEVGCMSDRHSPEKQKIILPKNKKTNWSQWMRITTDFHAKATHLDQFVLLHPILYISLTFGGSSYARIRNTQTHFPPRFGKAIQCAT